MNTQAQFFKRLKPTIPAFSSLAAEVAATLKVSMDSAYRRIRGEKLLDFNEISLLCQEFKVERAISFPKTPPRVLVPRY